MHLRTRFLRWPGVEVTDETGKLPPYVSTVLSFAVARFGIMVKNVAATQPGSALLNFRMHPMGSPFKGSRRLCRRGVELKPINYQPLALGCGEAARFRRQSRTGLPEITVLVGAVKRL